MHRNASDWMAASSLLKNLLSDQGYTGHTELDDLQLVHMGGRVYDPIIGRVLTADPEVQAPAMSQSYNRYSYCINNPTSLTDPSGNSWLGDILSGGLAAIVPGVEKILDPGGFAAATSKWLNHNWKTVVIVVAVVVVSVVTDGILTAPAIGIGMSSLAAGVVAGAAGGVVSGGLTAGLNGGGFSQIALASLIGGVEGAITGAVWGAVMPSSGMFLQNSSVRWGMSDYFIGLGSVASIGSGIAGANAAINGGDILTAAYKGGYISAAEFISIVGAETYFTEKGEIVYPEGGSHNLADYSGHLGHSGTNGILTSYQSAQRAADATGFPFFWNPSQGPINDVLQTFLQIVTFGKGDSIGSQYGYYASLLGNNITLVGHSQGAATVMSALSQYPELQPAGGVILEAPANNLYLDNFEARVMGLSLTYTQHWGDISNIYSLNLRNPVKVISGFYDIFDSAHIHTGTYSY